MKNFPGNIVNAKNLAGNDRRRCEGEFMDGRSRIDVTQSEGDQPDFNQSEHQKRH